MGSLGRRMGPLGGIPWVGPLGRRMDPLGWIPWVGPLGRRMGPLGWIPWVGPLGRRMGPLGWIPWVGTCICCKNAKNMIFCDFGRRVESSIDGGSMRHRSLRKKIVRFGPPSVVTPPFFFDFSIKIGRIRPREWFLDLRHEILHRMV